MTEYWNWHYKSGKSSGFGDIHDSRSWKMKILFDCGLHTDKSIIDVGCGDMVFWENLHLTDYTGIDISSYQIERNKEKYPNYKFYCANSSQYINLPKSDIVICFDMLFHIMNDDEYIWTLLNLTTYSKNKLFIYTWGDNPFKSFINKIIIGKPFAKNVTTDGKYQCYRDFERFSKYYIEGKFDLVNTFTDKRWKYGKLYYYNIKGE